MNKTAAQPAVYVVSLQRAVARRKVMSEQFARLGIAFTFVDAVDAKQVDQEWLHAQVDDLMTVENFGRRLCGPEIACALSHRQIYKDILARGEVGAIVLEDDVTILPVFLDALAHFQQSGPRMESELAVYHLEAMSGIWAKSLIPQRNSVNRIAPGLSFARLALRWSAEPWRTCGYYVSRATAASLLEPEKIVTVADHWSLWATRTGGHLIVSMPGIMTHPEDEIDSAIATARDAARPETASLVHRAVRLRQRVYRSGLRRVMEHVVRPVIKRLPDYAIDSF